MSARRVDISEIVDRYVAGYFPLYDENGTFYWERLSLRAVLPVNHQSVQRAKQLARRGKKRFAIRYTTAVEEIIAQLRREEVKEYSWVREEVVAIYRTLLAHGLLRTVEAWDVRTGALAGALLGITFPGTFIAETMYGVVPEASKVCLCQLVQDCAAKGVELIDVQTPHDLRFSDEPEMADLQTPHPCVRLGEVLLPLPQFQKLFAGAWRRAFAGGPQEWVKAAAQGGLPGNGI